jgi:hypothetical protein
VPSLLKRRSWQRATIWLLAVMQLHLLVVLVLHHHVLSGNLLALTNKVPASIGQTGRHSHPAGEEQGYCTGCQILRHSAVRPSLGNPTPHRSSIAPLRSPLASRIVFSAQAAAWHGRAPPLA